MVEDDTTVIGSPGVVSAAVPEPAADDVGRLHERLGERAAAGGVLDVAYRVVDTPFDRLLVAVTPAGVVRIAFEREGFDVVLAALAATVSPRILRADAPTAGAARQLEEYFAGRRRHFDLPVDLRLVGGFRRDVLDKLRLVPYGATRSYAALAREAGRPTAVRAAGSACSHNPIPIVVPCHRVVRSDGSIGRYLGGSDTKAALLAMESAA